MTGIEIIAAERQRQQDREGWTPAHDDAHVDGELGCAAACYALPEPLRHRRAETFQGIGSILDSIWPWSRSWWKPGAVGGTQAEYTDSRIRELAKAGALAAAEIDRLVRTQHGD